MITVAAHPQKDNHTEEIELVTQLLQESVILTLKLALALHYTKPYSQTPAHLIANTALTQQNVIKT